MEDKCAANFKICSPFLVLVSSRAVFVSFRAKRRIPAPSPPRPVRERIKGEGPITARGVRVSRSAPLIIRLSRLVAGEAAPKAG